VSEQPVLAMWTIYDHPRDFPNHFIARKWDIVSGKQNPVRTEEIRTETELHTLRNYFAGLGLMCLPRMEGDDPTILETWM
jgi:hypothetical protein